MKYPSYSARAARAIGWLKRRNNEIEIFVEDTSCRNMWNALIRRALPAHVKFKSVNMLGGRDIVEEACSNDQDVNETRRRLYIIDADFDFLHGKKRRPLHFLYRIRAYCVENLLIRKDVLLGVCRKLAWNSDDQTIENKLDFAKWMESEMKSLSKLFITYSLIQKAHPSTKTVGHSVVHFYKNTPKGPTIDLAKVRKHISVLLLLARKEKGSRWTLRQLSTIKSRAADISPAIYVSGKDYILPLLLLRLKALFGYGLTIDQLKVDLAEMWSPPPRCPLARRLRQAAA